jgi:hypothetical protein
VEAGGDMGTVVTEGAKQRARQTDSETGTERKYSWNAHIQGMRVLIVGSDSSTDKEPAGCGQKRVIQV